MQTILKRIKNFIQECGDISQIRFLLVGNQRNSSLQPAKWIPPCQQLHWVCKSTLANVSDMTRVSAYCERDALREYVTQHTLFTSPLVKTQNRSGSNANSIVSHLMARNTVHCKIYSMPKTRKLNFTLTSLENWPTYMPQCGLSI